MPATATCPNNNYFQQNEGRDKYSEIFEGGAIIYIISKNALFDSSQHHFLKLYIHYLIQILRFHGVMIYNFEETFSKSIGTISYFKKEEIYSLKTRFQSRLNVLFFKGGGRTKRWNRKRK